MRLFCLLSALIACCATTFAQPAKPKNLVINPSFEQRTDSSVVLEKSNPIESAYGWTAPNKGKSLLYTSLKKGEKYIVYDPNGSAWDFTARTGKNVAGVTVRGKREYIQGTLREPLTVGKKYYFAFWVHYHCEGANNLGIAFLPNKIKLDSTGLLPFSPASYQVNVTNYDKKNTWALVRDSFVAYKPFQNFVIGNFFPDSLTQIQSSQYNHYFAYIDDILVVEADNQTFKKPVNAEKEAAKWTSNITVASKTNTAIILENVYFKYNSSSLLPDSYPSINDLFEQLKATPSLKIRVKGHTSSEGTETYNQQLSTNRARAIRQYLIQKGIAPNRIEAVGYGETLPLNANDTEENMAKNRRVEFEITEK
jgi:OOP family OmpA-OmpF porin